MNSCRGGDQFHSTKCGQIWGSARVTAWHTKKHHHHVCALSHDRHGGWMILKHLSVCDSDSDFTQTLPWILAAAPRFPALSWRWWVTLRPQAVTQVWVTDNDLPLWVTWHSTSCTTIFQLQEQNCVRKMCQSACLMKHCLLLQSCDENEDVSQR